MDVEDIKEYLAPELRIFESKFRSFMKSDVFLLDTIIQYILHTKGKQIRPFFVFLSHKLITNEILESGYKAASFIELLHTATLVHDDVVDEATTRRSFLSINAIWKNKIAVLTGDYLLSKGLLLSVEGKEYGLLKIVSEAVQEMSEGELLQLQHYKNYNLSEEIYTTIIRKKTAALIGSCCAAGAAAAGAGAEQVTAFKEMGIKIGLAFQIKDDLLDFSSSTITGKDTGATLKDKKTTLPLIYTLQKLPYLQKRALTQLIKKKNPTAEDYQKVLTTMKENKGFEYATAQMNNYIQDVKAYIYTLPYSITREYFIGLLNFVIQREK